MLVKLNGSGVAFLRVRWDVVRESIRRLLNIVSRLLIRFAIPESAFLRCDQVGRLNALCGMRVFRRRCSAVLCFIHPVPVNTGDKFVLVRIELYLFLISVELCVIVIVLVEFVKRNGRLSVCVRRDLFAVPRNDLIFVISRSSDLGSCILIDQCAQHEISHAVLMRVVRLGLTVVNKININGLGLALGACEQVTERPVAETDRCCECSCYDAAEQSLEQ